MGERSVAVRDLGRIPFAETHELQLELVARRRAGECLDTLLICEHDPVVTLGRATGEQWTAMPLPGGTDETCVRAARWGDVPVCRIERGGEATYHGPGQLVAYPILDLQGEGIPQSVRGDIHAYLRALEEVIIRALGDLGVAGGRREGHTGVWVGDAKIAAIGIAIRRWITFHGLAVNIDGDLSVFSSIIPCGMPGCPVTSVAQERGAAVAMATAKECLLRRFAEVFCCEMVELSDA